MRLTARTTSVLLVAAGAPLTIASLGAVRFAERAAAQRSRELHDAVASSSAVRVGDALGARIRSVQQAAASVRFAGLGPAALRGALRLVYRQIPAASAVALFDAADQQAGVTELLRRRVEDDPALADRPALDDADLAAFGRHLPLAAARRVGAATSAPYVSGGGAPRLSVAALAADGFVLVAELSLDDLQQLIAGTNVGARGEVFVVDDTGAVVLARDVAAVATRQDRSAHPLVVAGLNGRPLPESASFSGLGPALGAAAPIPELRWTAFALEPADDALAASRTLLRGGFISLLAAAGVAVALGVILARALVRPIRALHGGAAALERGELTHRLETGDREDELGELARAFNSMATEIQRWRTELETRVDQRTRELKQAQELLLRSQKMAAVGELGAGVAHEINNPLTGLLGLTQLVLYKLPPESPLRERLAEIHHQGRRIQEIVEGLRAIAQDQATHLQPMRVDSAIDGALALVQGQLDAQSLRITRAYGAEVPHVLGDSAKLREAFLHLIQNARTAMGQGGSLTLAVDSVDKQLVSVRVTDTGVGIPKELHTRIFEPFFSSRQDGSSKGLGLSIVHRIVEEHRGRITVDSELGRGTTFTILLPAAQQRSLR